jgi:hypothetical protein
MPGKRSYVSAVPGCLTPQQLRRQARDRAFLPPPPPPPLIKAPRRFAAWEDLPIGDEHSKVFTTEQDVLCDPCLFLEQADPPSSGQFLAAIDRAPNIIELQCEKQDPQPTRTISLDALVPTPVSVAQPNASADASAEIIVSLEKRIASLQTTVCQNSKHIPIFENNSPTPSPDNTSGGVS